MIRRDLDCLDNTASPSSSEDDEARRLFPIALLSLFHKPQYTCNFLHFTKETPTDGKIIQEMWRSTLAPLAGVCCFVYFNATLGPLKAIKREVQKLNFIFASVSLVPNP